MSSAGHYGDPDGELQRSLGSPKRNVNLNGQMVCINCMQPVGTPHARHCFFSGDVDEEMVDEDSVIMEDPGYRFSDTTKEMCRREMDREFNERMERRVEAEEIRCVPDTPEVREHLQECRRTFADRMEEELLHRHPLLSRSFDRKLQSCGEEITALVREKNKAYGNSVNKTIDQLSALFPDGIQPEQYRDLLLMIRVLDKFNRLSCGDKHAFEENPWRDIAGYGIIGMAQGVEE